MPVDQGIADAKARLGAVYRYKPGDAEAIGGARADLSAATLYRDIRVALDAGITAEHRRVAMKILNGRA